MKLKLKLIALTGALLLVSGIALAEHDHACGKCKFDKAKWQEQRVAQFEQHQARLHTMLQLSAAQETAWNTFQTSIKPEEKPEHPDYAELSKLNTLQRLDKLQAWSQARDKKLNERDTAIRTFYAQLNDAQKKVFDENGMPTPPHHDKGQHKHHE